MTTPFDTLRNFITGRMRMSHIYQPVMLKTLLENGGRASIRQIAAAFLARDESQLEYYERITSAMPGKVLARHGLVERDGKSYRLVPNADEMSAAQRAELEHLCDEAIEEYLAKRGAAVFDHRRTALGYIPGSLRNAAPPARRLPLRTVRRIGRGSRD